MNPTKDEKQWDVRTLERKLRKGLLNKKDYDKYLKTLPDRADNAAVAQPDDSDDDGDE